MEADRITDPNPPLYAELLSRLNENYGVLPLNSEDALAFWITVLQRVVAECEFGTNSDPITDAPQLMVLGVPESPNTLTEVDLLKDDPRNILDETWSPIELRSR